MAPLIALTLIQPDLGTAIILGLVFISMMLIGGLRVKSFLALAVAGLAFLPIGWNLLWPYQRQRVLTFFDPTEIRWVRDTTLSNHKSLSAREEYSAKVTCMEVKTGWIFAGAAHRFYLCSFF